MDIEYSGIKVFGKFRLDTHKLILWDEDEAVKLSVKEVELLCLLIENAGEVLTKDELLDAVWKDSFVEESNLPRRIYKIRQSLKEHGETEEQIQTIPGRGYRFSGIVREADADEFLVQRHSVTQTLIEDFSAGDERLRLGGIVSSLLRRKFLAIVVGVLIIFLAFLAIWQFQIRSIKNTLSEIKVVAVLPLRSFETASDDQSLRLRITDALITRIGEFEQLAVRPTNAVIAFTDTSQDVVEIGKRLEVDAVFEGRIQEENGRLRITLQLISISSGEQLWSEQFDGRTGEILILQDQIASRIGNEFSLTIPVNQTPTTTNSEAYEEYLLGRYFWNQRTPESLKRGIEYFEKAVNKDPSFTLAYVGLAESHILMSIYGGIPPVESYPIARSAAIKVLELDKQNAAAHTVLAAYKWHFEYDFAEAEEYFYRAVTLDSKNVTARHWYGEFLGYQRRLDDALVQLNEARKLDPLSLIIKTDTATAYYNSGKFARAEEEYRKTLEINPNFPTARVFLALTLSRLGKHDDAIKEINTIVDRYPNAGSWLGTQATIFAAAGRKADALKAIEKIEKLSKQQFVSPYFIAVTYSLLGEKEKAFLYLNKAFNQHDWMRIFIPVDPNLDNLRNDERFQTLSSKSGISR